MRPAETAVRHEHNGREFWVGHAAGDHESCGLRWFVREVSSDGRGERWRMSSGCFYGHILDHPEGAAAWAEQAARRYLDGER